MGKVKKINEIEMLKRKDFGRRCLRLIFFLEVLVLRHFVWKSKETENIFFGGEGGRAEPKPIFL